MPLLRLATPADLPAINAIYNHYVLHSTATFQIDPETSGNRQSWFEAHDELHPAKVIEVDGRILAWGSLSKFHPRAAYAATVENSIYVHRDYLRQGLGRLLLADQIRDATRLGHHAMLAIIAADQLPSIALHTSLGFVEVARLKEVGCKFSRWLDVVYLEKMCG